MKKLLALLLTFVLMFSFVPVTAFAAENQTPPTNPGVIYINNASSTTSYKVYKLFDLDTMDPSGKSYSYAITDTTPISSNKWFSFIQNAKDEEGNLFFVLNEVEKANGKVKYNVTKTDYFSESAAVNFAKNALDYAKTNDIAPVSTEPTITGSVAKFDDLVLGYYLVDSSVGSLCGLTTTKPEGSITVKNLSPTIDKNVQEDSIASSSTNSWGKNNTADIGQLNKFDVTIFAQAGADHYVYQDFMENMRLIIDEADDKKYNVEDYKFKITYNEEELEENENYILTIKRNEKKVENGVTIKGDYFEIAFSDEFCASLKANDKVYITYSGKLNENAVIGGTGNKNIGVLRYGELKNGIPMHETAPAETITYTYGFDIVKTDHNYNALAGAVFKIYTLKDDGTKEYINLAYNSTTNEYRRYNVINEGLEESTDEIVVQVNNNSYAHGFTIARIEGLDNGTYYLEETTPPQGYNKLTTDRVFTISGSEIFATFTSSLDDEQQSVVSYDRGSGIHIENRAGATMPETGGVGKTMFIAFGTLAAIGTGVLLITKKRMSMFED